MKLGQGATEYLVLLAVVLIVALVSVALLGFFPGMASDAQLTQSQTYWQSASPIAVIEAPGAYAYTPNTAYAMAYWRIRNTGAYPIRLVKIYGQGGSTINESQAPGPLTAIYLAPGEETCFNHWALPSVTCPNGGPYGMYFIVGSGSISTHVLYGAKTVCNSDGTGILDIPQFGFEYIEYIEGQQITKREIGSKDLLIKCVGKT